MLPSSGNMPRVLRPQAVRLVSGVGSEEVEFEPAIPLEGKVEIYMQVNEMNPRRYSYVRCRS